MNKSCLASMATLLLWAGVTLGQGGGTITAPAPEKFQEPAAPWSFGDGVKSSCLPEPGPMRPGIFTADLEYVCWFLANSHDSVPVITTDVLGGSNTRVLGNLEDAEHAREGPSSGARLAFGYWEIQDNPAIPGGIRDLGAEAVFFFVGERSVGFTNDTSPTVVRPFFDLNNRQESAFIVAAPGLATGGVAAHAEAEVWGAEANVWKNVYYDDPCTCYVVNMMAGLRYLDLNQRLTIGSVSAFNQDLTAFPAFLPFAGNTLQVSDSFATHNHFFGAQVGATGQWWPADCLVIEGGCKLAIGETFEDLNIAGGQVRALANGARIASPGGLLALPSNSGHFHSDRFSYVPELDLKVATPLTSHLTLFTGFSALYWSRVLRPGEQIERGLDITEIPNFPPAASATPTGLNLPGVPFKQADLWVLGLHFGVEFNY